jgi:CubicO group peptidase (beta-lactamase class C family)
MLPVRRSTRLLGLLGLLGALVLSACTIDATSDAGSAVLAEPSSSTPTTIPTTTATTTTTTTPTTTATTSITTTPTSTTTISITTTTTTATTTTTTITTTTTPTPTTITTTAPTTTTVPDGPVSFDATAAAFASLAGGNAATSMSVWRDGRPALQLASGSDRSGSPVSGDTPMVVASVSKLITALTIARLADAGVIEVGAPVPWETMGFAPHPGWADVTVRELLDHTSGMPVARASWLDDPGSCAGPLEWLLANPPTGERGQWRYSNGNYCALGLLIEAVSSERYDVAGHWLVFGAAGVEGPHLTVDGSWPGDGPHRADVARFDRLGAAGSWLAGSDHVAAVLSGVNEADRRTLMWPGVFVDQYGWGHTGTVRGATACAWVVDDDRTVMVAVVAGDRPSSGGAVCDVLLPALGADLGLTGADGSPLGQPDRSPRPQ